LEVSPRFANGVRRPQRPRNLSITQRDPLAVTLSWDAARDADAYYLYRATRLGGDYQRVAVVTGTTVTDDFAIFPEHDYYYEIAAVGLGGMSRDSRIAKADALLDQRREMEDLDRGVVAVTTTDGVFVSWRLLATDAPGVSFLVFRNNR